MAELIKFEPGKSKLYLGVDDNDVDDSPQEFDWAWIKDATKLRKKHRFKDHLEQGHFGVVTQLGVHSYRFQSGHRAICRFNNNRFEVISDIIVAMDDYEDVICGRESKNGKIIIRGSEFTGNASLKKFDSEEFFALPRYTSAQCKMMATQRVERDLNEKTVGWYDLAQESYEYQIKWKARYNGFYEVLRKEMVLVAKRSASQQQIDDAIDLPASILALITRKLSLSQSEYYIARMVEYIETNSKAMSNPSVSYKVHQTILEEINIEHLRDLQRLHGDNVNQAIEKALNDALTRHNKLVPLSIISDAASQGDYNSGPPTVGTKDEPNNGPNRNVDGML